MNIWTHNDPGAYWNDVEFFENLGFQSVYSPFSTVLAQGAW